MRYLHTMLRVRNLDAALEILPGRPGTEGGSAASTTTRRNSRWCSWCAAEDEGLFKQAPKNRGAPLVELTYNWDEEKYGEDRYFGHLAYEVGRHLRHLRTA